MHSYRSRLDGNVGEAGTNTSDGDQWTDFEYFSATQLWNDIFSKHANIAAVLCGHAAVDVPIVQTRTGNNGNKVLEILVNPQDCDGYRVNEQSGGSRCGFVLMLNFSNNGKTIELEYISTCRVHYSKTHCHLAAFLTMQTVDGTVTAPTVSCETYESASARISTEKSGLRFKTAVTEEDLNSLIDTYGKANVAVGTLIAPTDKLAGRSLTHSVGTSGKDYIDVVADIDNPFASANGTRVYAGSISNIKRKNLDRDFTAVGYIAYRESANADWTYVYSETSAVRSIDYVAEAALADTSANYSAAAKAILEKLTYAYYGDPFAKDPFAS